MSVFRVNKTSDYTTMSNHHLKQKTMSLKAKGLQSLMLSLPDDWDYSMNGLCSICKESVDTVRVILRELEDFGYLKIDKDRNEDGKFSYNYSIFEVPAGTEKPGTVKPGTVFPIQVITNTSSTKKVINKKDINIAKIHASFPLPPKSASSAKKALIVTPKVEAENSTVLTAGRSQINLIFDYLDSYTEHADLKNELKIYLTDFRFKKRGVPTPLQWKNILDDLRKYSTDAQDAINKVRNAYNNEYMSFVPEWEKKPKSAYKAVFDNTVSNAQPKALAAMTPEELASFYDNLPRDESGNLVTF